MSQLSQYVVTLAVDARAELLVSAGNLDEARAKAVKEYWADHDGRPLTLRQVQFVTASRAKEPA